jgi:uncharacterized protein (DUF1786 family)
LKLLCVDIGAGTRDILLYNTSQRPENCIKMVLPSPSPLYAARVGEETARSRHLFLDGCVIGGGALTRAVKRHLAAGLKVYASRDAAFCLRNNLEDVSEMGVEVVQEEPPGFDGASMYLDELDLSPLESLLLTVGESLQEVSGAGVAVQDHGFYERGESNRKVRLAYMRRALQKDPFPTGLAYDRQSLPAAFPRMRSALERMGQQLPCDRLVVMDTAPAAVLGCLADPRVEERSSGNLLLVNAGNGHTMACILSGGRVVGLLEHHTARLEPAAFGAYLELFCAGKARDEDRYMRDGHGLFYLEEPPGLERMDMVAVTGPNRGLMFESGLDVYLPSPGGDMMMTGPMGLVRALAGSE